VAVEGSALDAECEAHWDHRYVMDVGTPWHRFMELGGKIVFFGADIASNSMIHVPEYVLQNEYPRPVYFSRPHVFRVQKDASQPARDVEGFVHAIRWGQDTVKKFCDYLNGKYGIYQHVKVYDTEIIVVKAKDQYDALMRELDAGRSWYDAIYWEGPPPK
jgi:aminoglycoside N3'-acetyltransferase